MYHFEHVYRFYLARRRAATAAFYRTLTVQSGAEAYRPWGKVSEHAWTRIETSLSST